MRRGVPKDRDELKKVLENTKRAFIYMIKFSTKLGGVTHETIKCSLDKVHPDLRYSIGTMIVYIINNTWVKLKILPFNWEVWNTRQKIAMSNVYERNQNTNRDST